MDDKSIIYVRMTIVIEVGTQPCVDGSNAKSTKLWARCPTVMTYATWM